MTKIVEEVLPQKRVFPYPFKNNNPLTAGVRELLFVTVLGGSWRILHGSPARRVTSKWHDGVIYLEVWKRKKIPVINHSLFIPIYFWIYHRIVIILEKNEIRSDFNLET